MAEPGPSVLVLHRMGNPALVPAFLPGHLRSYERSWTDGACLFHDVSLPLPGWVRAMPFDAVFLDVTLLATRWMSPRVHDPIRRDYAFIRDLPAMRVAFPQDEYDCSRLLDDWMCDWRVDLVVSVIDGQREVLYPRFHRQGRIELGFTGYVDEALIDRTWIPWSRRPIDIGYRAKRLPPYFGRLGELKWTIGRDANERARGSGLHLDIRVGDGHVLPGPAWIDFVGSCRAMLGTPSGSSLLDPWGDVQRRVRAFLRRQPDASFEEVERACFAGLDGAHVFSAISPRAIEAALAGTLQLLVDGDYSGVLRPGEHFLSLAPDARNLPDILEMLRDEGAVSAMLRRCREAVLSQPRLRRAHRDAWLRSLVLEHRARGCLVDRSGAAQEGVRRYEAEIGPARHRLWQRQAWQARVRRLLDRTPSRLVDRMRAVVARLRGRP
jgi:hypothetical protein